MKEEFEKKKIYKNVIPSSIIDYVGGNSPRKSNPHLLNLTRKRSSYYVNSKYDSKNNSPKITHLKPVKEIFKTDEESSIDSKDKEDNISIKSHKHLLKVYKSVNLNYKISNNNMNNNRIYGSSNKIYNYKTYNNILGNKYYMNNISKGNDNKTDIYNTFEGDIYSHKDLSRSFISSLEGDKNEFFLNKLEDSDDKEKEEQENNEEIYKNQKKKEFHKQKKLIKKKFYLIISVFYFSLYILCLKISLKLSLPGTPALGVCSFIISFNILFISLVFMKIDQIDYNDYLNFDKIDSYFFKIIFNYIRILLTIKSLQNLNLISFVLILNMN